MGLPFFRGRWLRKLPQRRLFFLQMPRRPNTLSIDANSILYKVAAEVFTVENIRVLTPQQLEEKFQLQVVNELVKVIEHYHPSDCVVIAFDGVAPVLKMQQQRQRRFKGILLAQEFDTTSLSPGTARMIGIDKAIQQWLQESWLSTAKIPVRVIYSGYQVPGEGEHKILQYFREGLVTSNGADPLSEKLHVIHGADTDLIILAMALGRSGIFCAANYEDEDLISIDDLKDTIKGMIGNRSIEDFVAAITVIGNDFIPGIPGLTYIPDNMEAIVQALSETELPLVLEQELSEAGFRLFLQRLWTHRDYLIGTLEKYHQYPVPAAQAAITLVTKKLPDERVETELRVDHQKFRQIWYSKWGLQRPELLGALENRLSNLLVEILGSAEKWANMIAESYLRVLRWIVSYYLKGQDVVNWNLQYPHFWAPLMEDLIAAKWDLPYHLQKDMEIGQYGSREIRLNILEQMIAILPRVSSLPDFLQRPVLDQLFDLYPSDFQIDYAGIPDDSKKHKGGQKAHIPERAIALIPPFDPYRLIQLRFEYIVPNNMKDRYVEKQMQTHDFRIHAGTAEQRFYQFVSNPGKKNVKK